MTSALCPGDAKRMEKYRKMTFDVTKLRHQLGFSPNLQDMFVSSISNYCPSLNKFKSSFDSFSVLAVQYGPGYIFSTYFDKNAVKFDFCMQMIPFFQETFKTKLN